MYYEGVYRKEWDSGELLTGAKGLLSCLNIPSNVRSTRVSRSSEPQRSCTYLSFEKSVPNATYNIKALQNQALAEYAYNILPYPAYDL